MEQIYTTYFCMTEHELRSLLADPETQDIVAVSPSAERSSKTEGAAQRLPDVMIGKASFLIAHRDEDIAYVRAASLWKRFYLALVSPRTPLGASLKHSGNAALIMIPSVEEKGRLIFPGFLSSYPRQSEIYLELVNKIAQRAQQRKGMLVSESVETLLDTGYKMQVG